MSNNLVIILIFSLFFGCQSQHKNVKVLPPDIFKQQIAIDSVQLIDVRTATEFNSGHIKNAINIDYFTKDFSQRMIQLNKEKPVYIYCRSGNRSSKAGNLLVELGFTEIYDLKGGYLRWKD